MRIVTREELLAMPEGVLAQEYEPHIFREPFIKLENLGTGKTRGFNAENLFDEPVEAFTNKTGPDPVELEQERHFRHDGGFPRIDQDKLQYAVWEPADIRLLINRLARLLLPEAMVKFDKQPVIERLLSMGCSQLHAESLAAALAAAAGNAGETGEHFSYQITPDKDKIAVISVMGSQIYCDPT
jgi:hypothetical protein